MTGEKEFISNNINGIKDIYEGIVTSMKEQWRDRGVSQDSVLEDQEEYDKIHKLRV